MSESTQKAIINTLDKKDLIDSVINKHHRFMGDYSSEFTTLTQKITLLEERTKAAKDNKENVIQRKEVLREKRQQLYHQAENTLADIYSLENSGLLDNKLMHSINDEIAGLKRAKDVDQEKAVAVSITERLANMPQKDDIQNDVVRIRALIDEGLGSSIEYRSIEGSDRGFDHEYAGLTKELSDISPRHNWLDRRIQSHKEALTYWEEQANMVNDVKEASS